MRQQRKTMTIRIATSQDREALKRIYCSAFPIGERETVSTLAADLLGVQAVPETLSLVAEVEGAVVGHVAFSPVAIEGCQDCPAYILAPLAVQPDRQQGGIGSALIEDGLQRLSARRVKVVFVYGDPAYYGRFGFSAEAAVAYSAPYKLQYPFGWQALVFDACVPEKLPAAITCVTPLCDVALW